MPRKRNSDSDSAAARPTKRRRGSDTFRSNARPGPAPRQTRSRAALPGAEPLMELDMGARPRRQRKKAVSPPQTVTEVVVEAPVEVSIGAPAETVRESVEIDMAPELFVSDRLPTPSTPMPSPFNRSDAPSPELSELSGLSGLSELSELSELSTITSPSSERLYSRSSLPDCSDLSDVDDKVVDQTPWNAHKTHCESPQEHNDNERTCEKNISFEPHFSFEPRVRFNSSTSSPPLPGLQNHEEDEDFHAVSPKTVRMEPISAPVSVVPEARSASPRRANSDGAISRKRRFSSTSEPQTRPSSQSPSRKRLKRSSSSTSGKSTPKAPELSPQMSTEATPRYRIPGILLSIDTDFADIESNGEFSPPAASPDTPNSSICDCPAPHGEPSPEAAVEADAEQEQVVDNTALELGHCDANDEATLGSSNQQPTADDDDLSGYEGSDESVVAAEEAVDRGMYPATHYRFTTALVPVFEMYHYQRLEKEEEEERQSRQLWSTRAEAGSFANYSDEENSPIAGRSVIFERLQSSVPSAYTSSITSSIEEILNLEVKLDSSEEDVEARAEMDEELELEFEGMEVDQAQEEKEQEKQDERGQEKQEEKEEEKQGKKEQERKEAQQRPASQQTIIPGLFTIYPETKPGVESRFEGALDAMIQDGAGIVENIVLQQQKGVERKQKQLEKQGQEREHEEPPNRQPSPSPFLHPTAAFSTASRPSSSPGSVPPLTPPLLSASFLWDIKPTPPPTSTTSPTSLTHLDPESLFTRRSDETSLFATPRGDSGLPSLRYIPASETSSDTASDDTCLCSQANQREETDVLDDAEAEMLAEDAEAEVYGIWGAADLLDRPPPPQAGVRVQPHHLSWPAGRSSSGEEEQVEERVMGEVVSEVVEAVRRGSFGDVIVAKALVLREGWEMAGPRRGSW